jgi:hypothetical protein
MSEVPLYQDHQILCTGYALARVALKHLTEPDWGCTGETYHLGKGWINQELLDADLHQVNS